MFCNPSLLSKLTFSHLTAAREVQLIARPILSLIRMPPKKQSSSKREGPIRKRSSFPKRTVKAKLNPQTSSFARISLTTKGNKSSIGEQELRFIVATAVKTVHGDIANEVDLLSFAEIDQFHYRAVIRFDQIHHIRVVTSLLLFGKWKETDIRFDFVGVAQTPSFLAL